MLDGNVALLWPFSCVVTALWTLSTLFNLFLFPSCGKHWSAQATNPPPADRLFDESVNLGFSACKGMTCMNSCNHTILRFTLRRTAAGTTSSRSQFDAANKLRDYAPRTSSCPSRTSHDTCKSLDWFRLLVVSCTVYR